LWKEQLKDPKKGRKKVLKDLVKEEEKKDEEEEDDD